MRVAECTNLADPLSRARRDGLVVPRPVKGSLALRSGAHDAEICHHHTLARAENNLGCIEINPWNSRVGTLDSPNYTLIDLDPEDVAFQSVIETAQAIRKLLDRIGAEARCKTSGKRGLHVYIPFGAQHGHDQAKHFAELIANLVNASLPSTTSLVRSPGRRQGRVYLDYLQNGKGKTLASAYSVRPFAGATVSTPLKWSEVRRGLDPAAFTIKTMRKRLGSVGDLWTPIIGPGIDLPACLVRLAKLVNKPGV